MDARGSKDATDAAPDSYIRGGAGFTTSSRRVWQVTVAFGLMALLVVAAALAVNAAHNNSRDRRLSDRGVPVTVTVTTCLGTATGTGITANGFKCHGTFELGGHQYTAVIGGSSRLLRRGDIVPGVADPKSPSTLSTVAAVSRGAGSWRAYLGPVSLTAGVLVVAGFLMWWSRRRRQARPTGGLTA